MSTSNTSIAPVRIEVRQRSRLLEIVWEDGIRTGIGFDALRAGCRCAACVAEGTSSYSGIELNSLNEMGANALQFHFGDGHSRGIYPFAYLRELGERASGTFPHNRFDDTHREPLDAAAARQ